MAKKKRIFTQEGLSRAGWLRQQILKRPTLTVEQMQAAFANSQFSSEEQPNGQALYGARLNVCKRYGLTGVEQIPIKPTGDLNMAGLVRSFLKLKPEATYEEAAEYFALDGLLLNVAIFTYAKLHPITATEAAASPDENQEAGPRAGAETRQKRVKKHRRTKAERLAELKDDATTFEKMERELEKLIEAAEHLGKSRLIQKLRDARRAASAAVLDCIG